MPEKLIDKIYESAFVPELWVPALDEMARMVDCDKAFIFTTDGAKATGFVANEAAYNFAHTFVSGNWMARNSQGKRTIKRRDPIFTVDLDMFTEEERNSDPFYSEFLKPHRAAWGTGTLVLSPSQDFIIFSIHRADEFGPLSHAAVQPLTDIRPHLARSVLMSSRLKLQQAQVLVGALQALGLPAATITANGRLHVANDRFQALVPDVVSDFRQRLHFNAPSADAAFAALVERTGKGCAATESFTIPVRASEDGQVPYIFHLVPIVGASRDIFSSARWVLVAVPVVMQHGVDPLVLEGLFDLSPAESRVARGIAAGHTLRDIAADNDVSFETVRSQLKAVLAKTGVHKQHELTALLGATTFFSASANK